MNDKVILFDLFGTLLQTERFDYNIVLDLIAERLGVTRERIYDLASEYRSGYMSDRDKTNRETSFAHQLKFYETKTGKQFGTHADFEWEAFICCRTDRVSDGAVDTLSYFKERGYKMAVLSNSIFSALTLKKYLDSFNLSEFFEVVISSADIGYRKPSERAFAATLEMLGVKASWEIYFVGNKIDKDCEGAEAAGLTPILIADSPSTEVMLALPNLESLKEVFESSMLYVNAISERESLVDGPGFRTVIYLQGCKRRCKNCHNPSTWSLESGTRYSVGELAEIIRKKAINKKITLSGGEPLLQAKAIENLIKALPEFDFCMYTGYDMPDIPQAILSRLHYVKVGAFDESCRTTTVPYFGSLNQKFINLREKNEASFK